MQIDSVLDRPLPHYLEAERCVLGVILNHQPALLKVVEKGLKRDEFFLDQHKKIFDAILSLDREHAPIDLVTVTEFLHRKGELEAAGGAAYISQITDGVPTALNIEHYAKIVKEKALLRKIIEAAKAVLTRAMEADEEADQVLDRAESLFFQLADERIRAGFTSVKQALKQSYQRLERTFTEGRRITGLGTGYPQLDSLTSGFQEGELLILAARPSMGKTALALNIAENVAVRAADKKPVAIFSLEMSMESLILRMLASHAQIDAHKFRTGHFRKDDWSRMVISIGTLSESPIWIDDSAASSIMEMSAKARRLKRDCGLSLVIVDYMQLISAQGKFVNRNEEVSFISRSLKAMAKELKVPMLVLSQLTRAPERDERKPQLADLRESGAIEQDADVVMFIHRPNFYKPDKTEEERREAELIIAKQRNGPTDRLKYVFLESFTRFEEQAPDSWQAPVGE